LEKPFFKVGLPLGTGTDFSLQVAPDTRKFIRENAIDFKKEIVS